MLKLTLKTLMGLGKLTIAQAIRKFDHPDYHLRDSGIIILSNDWETPEICGVGLLKKISPHGYITFMADGGDNQTVQLGTKKILIVLEDGNKPKHAIFD